MGLFSSSKSSVTVTQNQSVNYEPLVTSQITINPPDARPLSNVIPPGSSPAESSTPFSFGGTPAPLLDLGSQFPATTEAGAADGSTFGGDYLVLYLAIGGILLFSALRG